MVNTSTDLPFLLVYGAWVWKAALGVAAALSIGLVWAARAVLARRRVRARLATPLRGDEVELRGVLRGQGTLATTIYAEATKLARSDERVGLRAPDVVLETEDGSAITLEGPLQVVAGTSAAVQRDGVPHELSDSELEAAREQVDWLHRPSHHDREVFEASVHRLRAGDPVVVRGILERRAGTAESTFRGASEAQVVVGRGEPVLLYAQRPVTPPAVRPLAMGLGGAILGVLVGIGAVGAVGDRALRACEALEEHRSAPPWDNQHPCVVASTWRETRSTALALLPQLRPPIDGLVALEQTAAALRLAGRCAGAVDLLAEHDELERALELAKECGLRRSAHQLLLRDARYEEAAQLVVEQDDAGPALPSASTLIAAGHWRRAAAALTADAAASPRQACLVALLRLHGGDPDAGSTLRRLAHGAHAEACAPMLHEAALAPPAVAPRALDELPHPLALLETYASSFGAASALALPSVLSSPYQALPWLAVHVAEGELPPDQRRMLRHWRAVRHVFAGELPAARQSLAARDDEGDRAAPELEAVLAMLVELYDDTPTSEPARAALRALLEGADGWRYDYEPLILRAGLPLTVTARYSNGQRPMPALERAQLGNGADLIAELRSDYGGMIRDEDLLAVWPLVRTHRQELARAVRWRGRDRWSRDLPQDVAVRSFLRRELARRTGDDVEAARWHRRYLRADEVLSDRRRLVSLLLLEP